MLNFIITLCVAVPFAFGLSFLIGKAYKRFGITQDIDKIPSSNHLSGGETRITCCDEGFTVEIFENGEWGYLPRIFNAKMEDAKWMTPKPTPHFFASEGLAARSLEIYLSYFYNANCTAWSKLKP